MHICPLASAHPERNLGKKKTALNERIEHTPWIDEFGLEKEFISPESHYRKVSAFCTGFYGNLKSSIIFKASHI